MQQILTPKAKGYAIIGTRDPDEQQAEAANKLAFAIAIIAGQSVHTGAAYGIDEQAMQGTQGRNLTVYLPWEGYNSHIIPKGSNIIVYNPDIHKDWTLSVRRYHPAHNHLSRGAFSLHARNFGIIKEKKAVIAFPDEKGGGGTAQGIRIAQALGITVIQANRGTIVNAPVFIGKTLQKLGFASKDLRVTIPGR